MGNISFWDVRFKESVLQFIISASETKEYEDVAKITVGSCVWVEGITCLSKTGEFSICCETVQLAGACTHPLPDKRYGLQQGKRYSDRLGGLLSNCDSFELFKRISRATQTIRTFLWAQGFQEFSTGVLQERWEAGTANAFTTKCNANNKEYSLALTSETKLRRLQVAGFDDVFEILQSFRNEGIDSMHSPEFTLLEVSKTGVDYNAMMGILEQMLCEVTTQIYDSPSIPYLSGDIEMSTPFHRVSFYDACKQYLNMDRETFSLDDFIAHYPTMFTKGMGTFTWVFKVINRLLSPNCMNPTFITHLPSGISPFVKVDELNSAVTERAALVVQGIDLADIYSDENNPDNIRIAMEQQFAETEIPINEEYIRILEYGVPPSASIGVGLNRFFMLMRGNLPQNIKETILFPLQ